MKISKADFVGTGKVYSFTLQQYVKNKANIITFVILLLFCLASVPISALAGTGNTALLEDGTFMGICPERLYIDNQTSLPIEISEDHLASIGFSVTKIEKALPETLTQGDTCLRFTESDMTVKSEILFGEDSFLDDGTATQLQTLCNLLVTDARCRMLGISSEALDALGTMPSLSVTDAEEYLSTEEEDFSTQFALQYAYSILVMMLTLLSASYIIRAVIEEKASKLVELLMVSIKPAALLAGKILAMMTTVFVTLLSMVGAMLLSNLLSVKFLNTPGIGGTLAAFGIDMSKLNLGVTTVILSIVSIFIAYLTYSVLAGIAGSCCSAMEDADGANTLVILLVISGYTFSCISAAFSSPLACHFSALCPVISTFCAPVQYALGNISLGVFLLSLAIQAAIALWLVSFGAKVYRALIIHRGKRVKWQELFKIAKEDSGK